MTLLSQLENSLPTLSKAESAVARAILADPDAAVNMTTAGLAKLAGVSDPMVSRFCRSLGHGSFPEFKLQLARSLASQLPLISEAVSPGDDAARYIDKRINANRAALEYLREQLHPGIVTRAVTAMVAAARIEIFGMGGSAAIAQDAQHKLFRLGIPTNSYADHLMQRMVAAGADQRTVVLCFSFTGRTRSMIEAATIAGDNGATVIAVTRPRSPLAEQADIVITSGDELEDTTIYVPMTTRIISLTIIDILATGMALSLGPAGDKQLQKIKHSLDGTKVD